MLKKLFEENINNLNYKNIPKLCILLIISNAVFYFCAIFLIKEFRDILNVTTSLLVISLIMFLVYKIFLKKEDSTFFLYIYLIIYTLIISGFGLSSINILLPLILIQYSIFSIYLIDIPKRHIGTFILLSILLCIDIIQIHLYDAIYPCIYIITSIFINTYISSTLFKKQFYNK